MIPLKLRPNSATQAKLYEILQRNGDVHFRDLYLQLGFDPARADEVDAKGRFRAQSFVGKYIARLNRNLKGTGERVTTGRLRRTYCLTKIEE